MAGLIGLTGFGGELSSQISAVTVSPNLVTQGEWGEFIGKLGGDQFVLMETSPDKRVSWFLGHAKRRTSLMEKWGELLLPRAKESLPLGSDLTIFKVRERPTIHGTDRPDKPVRGVSLMEALAYCSYHHLLGRLPTVAEVKSVRAISNPYPELVEWVVDHNPDSDGDDEYQARLREEARFAFRVSIPSIE